MCVSSSELYSASEDFAKTRPLTYVPIRADDRTFRVCLGGAMQLHANDGDHTIHGFDPRTDQLLVYGVTNARLEKDSTAGAVKVHLPDGRVIRLALRNS